MNAHPRVLWDRYAQIADWVQTTRLRSGWRVRSVLAVLGIVPSTYYRVTTLQHTGNRVGVPPRARRNALELLPEERMLILDYSLTYPTPRHRVLAYELMDAGIVCASPTSVYRLLAAKGLVPRWPQQWKYQAGRRGPLARATGPDEKWLVDPTYVRVRSRWWYLIYFIDEYSRYIVYWDLLHSLDDQAMMAASGRALAVHGRSRLPVIQTDNGSGFISDDFKRFMAERGISHQRIHPHQPTENAIVERGIRTMKELAGDEFEDVAGARQEVGSMVSCYNLERRHSALYYLRPVDYYRGNPGALLAERAQKIAAAREHRMRINLSLARAFRGQSEAEKATTKDSLSPESILSHSS